MVTGTQLLRRCSLPKCTDPTQPKPIPAHHPIPTAILPSAPPIFRHILTPAPGPTPTWALPHSQAEEMLGHPILLNSSLACSKTLFGDLHLKPPAGGRTLQNGLHSTSEDVLVALQTQHTLPGVILRYEPYVPVNLQALPS